MTLSNREWEVVEQLLQGKSNKLIALSLDISVRTVEFHLKNIYAKYQVNSRIELILKLANTTGNIDLAKLRPSTVVRHRQTTENRDGFKQRTQRKSLFSMIGKELDMKALWISKQVLVGILAALVIGSVWIFLITHFDSLDYESIRSRLTLILGIFAILGLIVGLVGKRNGSSSLKVGLSTLLGTGFTPITILPLMRLVVAPLGELAERIGWVNAATMPAETGTTLVILTMMAIWLVVGAGLGILVTFLNVKKLSRTATQGLSEQRL
jgi:DNA-binding CsgD family transcriptional regulator